MEILVFTDGGGFKKTGGKFDGVSAFRIYTRVNGNYEELETRQIFMEDRTSAFAEINAIAEALLAVRGHVEKNKWKDYTVRLYTDSMLYFRSLTQWIYGWMKTAKKGIFYGSKGEPIVNQDQIKAAFQQMQMLWANGEVKFYHINSHVAKKKVKDLRKKFEEFNKCKVTEDEFLFIYLQNQKCDQDVQAMYESVMKK